MNYCSECGQLVEKRLIPGDSIARFQCTGCGMVHYQNPKVLVSCYATWGDKVLWIRRGTEPFKGKWAAPSGFVEQHETLAGAAARELYEETRAQVDTSQLQLHLIGNLMHMNQVYIVFRAPLLKPEFGVTDEAMEVALFSREDFPWEEFAFPELAENVELFYRDMARNHFGVYQGVLENGNNTITRVSSRPY